MPESKNYTPQQERKGRKDIVDAAMKVLLGIAGFAIAGASLADIYADGTFDALGLFTDRHPFLPDNDNEQEWAENLVDNEVNTK